MAETNPRPGWTKVQRPEGQVTVHQLIEGGFLARVLPVAQPFFLQSPVGLGQLPGPLR